MRHMGLTLHRNNTVLPSLNPDPPGLTFARERWRRELQGVSSGRNSRGLPKSCRERRCASARRSITGADSRLASRDSSRSCAQRRISPARGQRTLQQPC